MQAEPALRCFGALRKGGDKVLMKVGRGRFIGYQHWRMGLQIYASDPGASWAVWGSVCAMEWTATEPLLSAYTG